MPQSFCQLNTTWGLSFRGRLAYNARYGQAVADLESWGDLPAEMILPNDKSVGDVLTWLRDGNATAPDYKADLRLTITNLKETKIREETEAMPMDRKSFGVCGRRFSDSDCSHPGEHYGRDPIDMRTSQARHCAPTRFIRGANP